MEGLFEVPIVSANSLGSYQLVAEIGRGGMADVFLALAPPVQGKRKQVVIKQLRKDVMEDDDFRAMFLDEARLAMKLNHPNVVTTFEVGNEEDTYFIVMEFLDGQPLSRIRRHARKNGAPAPLGIYLRVFADVLSGLHYVHELKDAEGVPLGVVHRDVTPQNVFVTYDGCAKVVDFGIAKARARQVETRIGVVKGKLSYIAPENVRGEPIDRRSDIFSVGVMLWEAAAGKRFWQGLDELAIYQRLVDGEIAPSPAGVDPEVFAVIARALSPDPKDRFATAAEMQAALERISSAQRASRPAVSGYLYHLFVEERRRFHRLVQEEVDRLEVGEWPIDVPSLRPDSPAMISEPNDLRIASTVRPGLAGPSSVRTSPTATSFFTPTSPTLTAPMSRPKRATLYLGLAGLAIVISALILRERAVTAPSVAATAALAATPAATVVPSAEPAALPTVVARAETPSASAQPPGVVPKPLPMGYAKTPAKKASPEGFDDFRRDPRPRRALDAEDPWTK
jgi:serine/threonine-protein kinase